MPTITQALLRADFDYHLDGFLIRTRAYHNVGVGKIAGCLGHDGYWQLMWNRKMYRAHRLIYLWHHGHLPELIDHIDQDRANNRIENLRAADKRLNALNNKAKNVSFNNRLKLWVVQVGDLQGKTHVKYRKTEQEALELAQQLRTELRTITHDD